MYIIEKTLGVSSYTVTDRKLYSKKLTNRSLLLFYIMSSRSLIIIVVGNYNT